MPDRETYLKVHEDLSNRQLSDSQNYDKAILSLSSAGLGVSIAFLTRFSPHVVAAAVLITSWILFILAIGSTLGSFLVSKCAIKRQFELAERLYLKDVPGAETERNRSQESVGHLAHIAGALFFLAICLTAVFMSFNIGGHSMATKDSSATTRNEGPVSTDRTGQTATHKLAMPTDTRGAGVAPFIPLPSTPAPAPAPAQTAPVTATPAPSPKSSAKP